MSDDSNSAIKAIVNAVAQGSQKEVQTFLDNLSSAQSSSSSPTGLIKLAHIASEQPNGTSAQVVGNGTLQAFSPSFTGLAFGATAFKADESGVSFFGHTLFQFPWVKDKTLNQMKVDLPRLTKTVAGLDDQVKALKPLHAEVAQLQKVAGHVAQQVEYPRTGLIDETSTLKTKLAAIETTMKTLPDALERESKSHLTQGGNRGVASNTAELDAIKKAVEELAAKLGNP